MLSAIANAAFSASVKSSLNLNACTAATFSRVAPALLLPAAFASIQKGHPAI
jgi:hypothetical protein